MSFLLWHGLRDSVAAAPDRLAVEWRKDTLTYRQLDELSDAVASALGDAGIGRGHRVALYTQKTHRSVAAMLGISKTGAAYVPIDPHAPPLRAAYILGDCAVSAVVASHDRLQALRDHRADVPALRLGIVTDDDGAAESDDWIPRIRWSDLTPSRRGDWPAGVETDPAYLLYTSGSTGKPKGVIITHRNALTFIDWGAETFQVTPSDRLSNHAPLHFDLSVFDIYVALSRGASVVMVPDQVALFPRELARWIHERRISVWYSVPSALIRMLLHGDLGKIAYAHLRTVLFAGEVFPQKYLIEVMGLLPHASFFNLYGPTETNVCTFYPVPHGLDPSSTSIPIGAACANTEVFAVAESDGRLSGAGEEGELLVRGGTVMAGYWGLPEKTAQVLITNQLQPAFDDRVYRTGDIVKLAADGNYLFVGRRDFMVKSRGYRIELGEIEQVLHQHDKVREAAVVPVPDEEIGVRLQAFVAAHHDVTVAPGELQAFCLARLPAYMVPEAFVIRAELPKTSTGKTDRQALLAALKEGTQVA